MSWPNWQASAAPIHGLGATPGLQSSILPAAPGLLPPSAAAAANSAIQYSPDQWAQIQQQNWQQWAQWQQQYQQWHQQYGAEYQKSLNALSTSSTNTSIPPPPPNESKPPPPPPEGTTLRSSVHYNSTQNRSITGYNTFPTTAQNYVTSASASQYSSTSQSATTSSSSDWPNSTNKRPLAQSNNTFEGGNNKRQMLEMHNQWNNNKGNNPTQQKSSIPGTWQNNNQPSSSTTAKIAPTTQKATNLEELTEAEKKFDKEFAAWEAQFNKWKEQNANHPDKTQYLEYEKKWEAWRNSLLERREQMRKKRIALQASMSATAIKPPTVQQHFTKPPPQLPSAYTATHMQKFNKSLPTQNNEPLNFKPPAKIPEINSHQEIETMDGNTFLNSSNTSSQISGGIPGLDLVKENETFESTDREEKNTKEANNLKGPDFDAISKGINNILGDTKLMNILSMVSKNQTLNNNMEQQKNTTTNNNNNNAAIPSLLNLPIQRPNFENKTFQNFEESSDHHHFRSSEMMEAVNNFDDQTRMSFSNGPNDYELNYTDSNTYSNKSNNRSLNLTRNTSSDHHHHHQIGPIFGGRSETPLLKNSYQHSNYQYNNEDEWNEENNEDYNNYHSNFQENEENIDRKRAQNAHHIMPEENLQATVEEVPLFVPQVVIDYEHKSLKQPEPEISVDIIRTYDYRHKSVNRIPYPQRPIWLSSTLRNIRQFDPLSSGRFNTAIERNFDREPFRFMHERTDPYPRRPFDQKESKSSQFSEEKPGFFRNQRGNVKGNYAAERPNRFEDTKIKKTQKIDEPNLELEELSDDDDFIDDNKEKKPSNTQSFSSTLTLEDLISRSGNNRQNRPAKVVIILRGPPGSGKTYLAKLIKDREVENGGSAPRILSLDDYFMVEREKEIYEDGKKIRIKEMVYEYEAEMEESYRQSLIKSFKKTITDGYFQFIVVDNVNQKVKNFGEMWNFAKQHGFQVYICQMDLDPGLCTKRNIHHRTESYIEECIAGWEPTPAHHSLVDATTFLQNSGPIIEVEMEEQNQTDNEEQDEHFGEGQVIMRSKWDTFDCSLNNLARLDGLSKPLRTSRTMQEYLQLDNNEWEERTTTEKPTKPGQKRVRWADLEEQKQQEKMKALGFVVGHTDWNRIMDPTNGESALIQTKFIESRYDHHNKL